MPYVGLDEIAAREHVERGGHVEAVVEVEALGAQLVRSLTVGHVQAGDGDRRVEDLPALGALVEEVVEGGAVTVQPQVLDLVPDLGPLVPTQGELGLCYLELLVEAARLPVQPRHVTARRGS